VISRLISSSSHTRIGSFPPTGIERGVKRSGAGGFVSAASASGNETRIVVPSPIRVVHRIVPPCASTRSRTVARPSPVPSPSGFVV
jgi:hypothetical protein